jgi:hypothetical protein
MNLETLKTPGLVLDLAKVKRNAERMSRRIKQFGAVTNSRNNNLGRLWANPFFARVG